MRPLAPEHLLRLQPYQPGKPIEEVRRELGLPDDLEIIKLASNENSLGPSPKGLAAAQASLAEIHRYPDGGGFYLKRALAERYGVADRRILLGNGSNEIIELMLRAFVGPDDSAAISATTFVVYKLVLSGLGRRFHEVPTGPGLAYDLDAIADAIVADPAVKMTFVASPNNPTGLHIRRDELDRFLGRIPDDVVVVLDEAYFEYVTDDSYPDSVAIQRDRPRTVTLRTFSKAYGLAGLRIGYGLVSEEIADVVERVRQPFNCNSVAQSAALAALADHAHIERSRQFNLEGSDLLIAGLEAMGLAPLPTQANFVLVDLGREAKPIFEALLRRGVIVRLMGVYGLPNHIRITVGTPEQNQACLHALKGVLA